MPLQLRQQSIPRHVLDLLRYQECSSCLKHIMATDTEANGLFSVPRQPFIIIGHHKTINTIKKKVPSFHRLVKQRESRESGHFSAEGNLRSFLHSTSRCQGQLFSDCSFVSDFDIPVASSAIPSSSSSLIFYS